METDIGFVQFSKISDSAFSKLLTETVFSFISYMGEFYPNFRSWFFNKVIPGINDGTREIFLFLSSSSVPIACLILKKTTEEKKICTLSVHKDYRRKGYGTKLFEIAINYLETKAPILTMPEQCEKEYAKLLKKFNFIKTKTEFTYEREIPEPEVYFNC